MITSVETQREASVYALPLQGVVYVKFTTFLETTAMQRYKLSCRLARPKPRQMTGTVCHRWQEGSKGKLRREVRANPIFISLRRFAPMVCYAGLCQKRRRCRRRLAMKNEVGGPKNKNAARRRRERGFDTCGSLWMEKVWADPHYLAASVFLRREGEWRDDLRGRRGLTGFMSA